MSTIASITYRPTTTDQPVPAAGYLRVALAEATLIEAQGIADDYNSSPHRNLNIMDAPTLAELAAEGLPTSPGALGENIVLDGLDLRTLRSGTRLHLGEQAVVEIGEPRNGCPKLTAIDARMPALTKGRIGVMAQVITPGTIRVGDPVVVIAQ